jgi:hypothetical protein
MNRKRPKVMSAGETNRQSNGIALTITLGMGGFVKPTFKSFQPR